MCGGGGVKGEAVCRKFALNPAVLVQLRDLRLQFADLLKSIGFLPRNDYGEGGGGGGERGGGGGKGGRDQGDVGANVNSGSNSIVCGVICAGIYPNIARVERVGGGLGGGGGDIVLRGQAGETREFVLHKSSALYERSEAVAVGALVS